jgi:ribosomal protein L29
MLIVQVFCTLTRQVQNDLQAHKTVHDTTAAELLTLTAAHDKLQKELQHLQAQAATAGVLEANVTSNKFEDNDKQVDAADELRQKNVEEMMPEAVELHLPSHQPGVGSVCNANDAQQQHEPTMMPDRQGSTGPVA